MFAKYVKGSVPCFLIAGVASLSLIFLLRLVIQDHLEATVNQLVIIKDYQQSRWGEIPGALNYEFKKNITFYSLSPSFVEEAKVGYKAPTSIALTAQDTLNFEIARNYTGVSYIPNQAAVNFTEDYDIQMTEDSKSKSANANYAHLNVAGLSLWYQMTNKPDFYKAFEALTRVRQQFVDEFFLRGVAYQAYYYIFQKKDIIVNSVLFPFDKVTAGAIYQDEILGLDTPSKLFFWFQALIGQQGSYMYTFIQNYYIEKGIQMTNTALDQILSKRNMFQQIYSVQESLAYKLFQNDSSNALDEGLLWQKQWGNTSIFADERYYLSSDVPHVLSFKDLDPSDIVGHTEYSYYVQNILKDPSVPMISQDSAAGYFQLSTSPKSLMNPVNLQIFFENIRTNSFAPIQKRFSIDSIPQILAMKGYFDLIVKEQTQLTDFKGTYEQNVFGKLILKALNDSLSVITSKVPFELTSRYLAAYIKVNNQDCTYYVQQAVIDDAARVKTICDKFIFDSLDNVKLFLAPIYFSDPKAQNLLMNATGMNSTEIASLFNVSNPISFAVAATSQDQLIHDFYGCTEVATYCTDEELATQQWGSSNLTLNTYAPYKVTSFLKDQGYSVHELWGIGNKDPEYFYYSNKYLSGNDNFTIPPLSVMKIFNNVTGILSPFKAAVFVINVTAGIEDIFKHSLGIPSAVGFLKGLRFMIQEYIMGGFSTSQDVDFWLYGYQSNIFDLVSQGDFYEGNDKDLVSLISPIFNNETVMVSQAQIKMNSGSSNPYLVGEIQQINSKPYVNTLKSIYNGNSSQPVPVNPWSTFVPLDSVTNGLQFAPQTHDGIVKAYDNLYQRHFEYEYSDDDQVEGPNSKPVSVKVFRENKIASATGDDLKASPPNTLNVGPSSNIDLVIARQGCIGCTAALTSQVTVGDKAYSEAVPQVDLFETSIEPASGFMINQKKAISVFVYLRQAQSLPFPSLDLIGQQLVPLYDIYEEQSVDTGIFQDTFGFVEQSQKSRKQSSTAFIVLTVLFLLLGIAGMIYTAICGKRNNLGYSEIEN